MNVNSSRRTIVINGSSLLYSAPNNSLAICTMNTDIDGVETQKKGRKRSLEHLSFEEKLLRKKLKNREAAQSSRDRKKARMDELEKTVKLLVKRSNELSSQIEALKCEKTELHQEVTELRQENDRLKEENRCLRDGCSLESRTGSAESFVIPLLKGHSRHPVATLNPPLIQLILFQMIISIGSLTMATMILPISMNWLKTSSPNLRARRITINSSTRWWGRHQRCWNPVDRNQNYLRVVSTH